MGGEHGKETGSQKAGEESCYYCERGAGTVENQSEKR